MVEYHSFPHFTLYSSPIKYKIEKANIKKKNL